MGDFLALVMTAAGVVILAAAVMFATGRGAAGRPDLARFAVTVVLGGVLFGVGLAERFGG